MSTGIRTVAAVASALVAMMLSTVAMHCGSTGSLAADAGRGGASDATSVVDEGQDSLDAAPTFVDVISSFPDSGFTIIDGGTDCALPPTTPGHAEVYTCCAGAVCPGLCVQRGAQPPHCECVGVVGGCVAPTVCCLPSEQCTGPNDCTIGPPPPGGD